MVKSKEELKWRADSDANIMAQYQEIISDKRRLTMATKAARQKAADLTKRANALNTVSKTKRK